MHVEKFKELTRPFCFWESRCGYKEAEIVIIPAPYDGTCSNLAGCRKGPFAIIDESMETELYDLEYNIDAADKIFTLDPLIVFDDAKTMQNVLKGVVQMLVSDKKTPVVLGGDHSLTPAAVFALKKATQLDFFILHFDAHSDLRPEYRGNSLSHASPMYRIHSANDFKLIQVGVRSTSKEISDYLKKAKDIYVFNREKIYSDFVQCLLKFRKGNVYISFDFDVYDPCVMPCVGTPEPNGLHFKDVCFVFDCLRSLNIKIIGADFMEFSPHNFQHNAPANLAVRTIGKAISLIALQRRGVSK